jgi:hypothetical protein
MDAFALPVGVGIRRVDVRGGAVLPAVDRDDVEARRSPALTVPGHRDLGP